MNAPLRVEETPHWASGWTWPQVLAREMLRLPYEVLPPHLGCRRCNEAGEQCIYVSDHSRCARCVAQNFPDIDCDAAQARASTHSQTQDTLPKARNDPGMALFPGQTSALSATNATTQETDAFTRVAGEGSQFVSLDPAAKGESKSS